MTKAVITVTQIRRRILAFFWVLLAAGSAFGQGFTFPGAFGTQEIAANATTIWRANAGWLAREPIG